MSVTSLVLFSVLLALLALALAAKPSDAHYRLTRSVDITGDPARLKWNGSPPDFINPRDFAVDHWDGLNGSLSIYRSDSPHVVFGQINADTNDNTVGYYTWHAFGADEIDFYRYNIRRFNFDTCDRNWVGVHEVGHSLSFAHTDGDFGPFEAVMYSFHRSDWDVCATQFHDRNDFANAF